MSRLTWVSIILLLAGLLLVGCKQTDSLSSASEVKTPAAKASVGVSMPAWEEEWDRTVAGAKKEGKLVILGSATAALRDVGMDKFFDQKFGLSSEYTGGSASEIIPKLLAERRAGLYLSDIFMISLTTGLSTLKPSGATQPLDKALFLPEVLNPKAWYQGELPWADKDHHQLPMLAMPVASIVVNTEMVKPEEIGSYRDLLNPKWKGQIALMDPTQAGGGASWFSAMAEGIMDVNFLREFGKQEPVISRNDRLMAEWVARGKYPIMVGLKTDLVAEFRRAGAPLDLVVPKEGTYVAASSGGLALLKDAPHPNAAKLFLNWVLTKEGATFVARAFGGQSARVDVPTDFIDPKQVRQPGGKYLDANNEEFALKKVEHFKLAGEIFAGSLK
ncbi:MAG: extracellular solute-binding protein [Chloroflexi bacterium]|nr:extracellular solute-binding protein [Chloroflexota bacterium]